MRVLSVNSTRGIRLNCPPCLRLIPNRISDREWRIICNTSTPQLRHVSAHVFAGSASIAHCSTAGYVAALRWLAAAVRTTPRWSACCLCSPSDFSRIQLRFRVKIRRLLASFSCINPFCRSHSPILKSNLKNAATRLRRHRRTSGR